MSHTSKLMIAYFQRSNGVPYTGLSPTIRIWEVSPAGADTLVINGGAMVEVGDGFYKYNFTSYDYTKTYATRMDAGNVPQIGTGQYAVAINSSFYQDIVDGAWNEPIVDHLDPGSTGEALDNASNAGAPANPPSGGMG